MFDITVSRSSTDKQVEMAMDKTHKTCKKYANGGRIPASDFIFILTNDKHTQTHPSHLILNTTLHKSWYIVRAECWLVLFADKITEDYIKNKTVLFYVFINCLYV